jgi:hypothetical protein
MVPFSEKVLQVLATFISVQVVSTCEQKPSLLSLEQAM